MKSILRILLTVFMTILILVGLIVVCTLSIIPGFKAVLVFSILVTAAVIAAKKLTRKIIK